MSSFTLDPSKIIKLLNSEEVRKINNSVFEVKICDINPADTTLGYYIVKRCRSDCYEAKVLQMVNDMNIPSPKLLYTFTFNDIGYVIMEKVDGQILEEIKEPEILENVYVQIREVLTKMRAKTNNENFWD
jgi:hypothetical protein